MPRQYAFAPEFGEPTIDRAQLAVERERRLAEAQQHANEYRTQSLGLRREALTDTGERFAVSEKRQQALADSTIANQKLTGQKTAFELKQANDKAKREQTALKYFTVANVLESSIDDPRAFDLNPEVAAFWRKKYPGIDNMTREQKMQLATMRRRYGQDLIDGKGVEASVLRAGLQRDAATERERVQKELQEKNLTAAGERQDKALAAAKERRDVAITPLNHVTIRKALTDLTGRDPLDDTIRAVADLVKNQGVSLQDAMKRVRVPLKGRDEAIMAPARAAFRDASAAGDNAALVSAREGVASALQQTDTPEDVAWDRESGTLVPVSALAPDIPTARTVNRAVGSVMEQRETAAADAAKQADKDRNGIADEDEVAMAWAKENAKTRPNTSKAIIDRIKAKYPGIYGVQDGGK